MSEETYRKLAKVLHTLPPGFPPTESGAEIILLKKIFKPEEADLFCSLRMTFETAEEIAERTGRPLEGLEDRLNSMFDRGQIRRINRGPVKAFALVPWASGLYELQLDHVDEEFARLVAEIRQSTPGLTMSFKPQVWQSLPIEETIPIEHQVLPHQQISAIIEKGKEFWVRECICKKTEGLLGRPCGKPTEVCLSIDPFPEILGEENRISGRKINKEEAYALLDLAEKEGLVHMTANTETDQYFICNCCGCCCGAIRGAKILGSEAAFNSFYYAEIDSEVCIDCGICKEERCQVAAIEESDSGFRIKKEQCIGCGLCITACPTEAIKLVAKNPDEIVKPLKTRSDFWAERARQRGVDFSAFQ